jgi:SAM-dependent methyltransferase
VGLKLEQVVPWGRSFTEYIQMFNLSEDDLKGNILDCAGGPASFNADLTQRGGRVISCDPVYQFSVEEIKQRIDETYPVILQGVEENLEDYVWQEIPSPAALMQVRMTAMQQFLEDFPAGLQHGRYLNAELPNLPFANAQFDLVLCSHLLFTYSDHLSLEFHLAAIAEMGRVASEVRIFPLLNVSGEPSLWLEPVMAILESKGYHPQVQPTAYEFQKGGNQLLQIKKAIVS